MRTRSRLVAAIAMLGIAGIAASCVPPAPPAPKPIDWSFRGTGITVNNSQDETCIIICVNREDEPYLIHVAFRVTIGKPGSASSWVVEGSEMPSLGAGQSRVLSPGEQAKVTFAGVKPLDVLDALNPKNKLDIVGTYTWAAEADQINSLGSGAGAISDIFENVLNSTLAAEKLPDGDAEALLGLLFDALFDNIGTPFNLILSNIPCLGLCDDVLGGAVYVGLGATGSLAQVIESAAGDFTIPSIAIPLVSVPPDVQGGGIYTMRTSKNFTQTFSGADGVHTYSFQSAAN